MSETTSLLSARNISKAFPGVQALSNVCLDLSAGEVLAVVGENGAGKSTLMKILGGVYRPDAGEIRLDGRLVEFHSVAQAQQLGVALIHQELNLAENLDIAGNVFLGREPTSGGLFRLIHPRIYAEAENILAPLGLTISPRTRVGDLSIGQQQLVEIGRALALNARIIIMDEPTSSLTQRETDRLFEVIRDLKQAGIGVLYISHRLQEIERIADRVVVLRDGQYVGELRGEEIEHEAMVRMMVGRELKQFFHRTREETVQPPRTLLEGKNLRWLPKQKRGASFSLAAGEIVGLAGLMGAGRTELAEAIFGIRPLLDGEIYLEGRRLVPASPSEAIAAGIMLLPEDRRLQGLVLPASVKDNVVLASLMELSKARLVDRRREADVAEDMCRRLNIRTPSIYQTVALLSGGNQQKVALAKWLCRQPRVLLLDEPTRGVDVGAKTEIYALMDQLAREGMAILMISSDLEEILGMSDRVYVMYEGRLTGELKRSELSEEAVMRLATGGDSD
ncbi:MAG: ribose import ATP-binding protein RbsA [Gemmatales bacterium]|nr:MAG: ribose import ATP-binding protein RbsA [Gemmatales bacterium]